MYIYIYIYLFILFVGAACRDRTSITGGSPVMLVSVYLECMRYKIEKIEKEVLKSLSLPLNIEGLIQLATASEAASCDVILNDCVRVLCDCSFALFSGAYNNSAAAAYAAAAADARAADVADAAAAYAHTYAADACVGRYCCCCCCCCCCCLVASIRRP